MHGTSKLRKFAFEKNDHMEYGKKFVRHISRCLECGDQIRYGRTDKKFCCEECKARHHNNMAKAARAARNKILAMINRNYDILDELLEAGKSSADLLELTASGFTPSAVTSYRRSGKHDEFTCYDIRYFMTRTRLFSIMKIQNLSVNLRFGTELKDL